MATLSVATASPVVMKFDRNTTTLVVKGFTSGFLGENIEDMGSCGTVGVDMIIKTQDVFDKLFHGRVDTYMKAFMEMIEIMTLVPKEIKNCVTIKRGLEKLKNRTNQVMNVKEFVKQIIFNTVFHSIDIASAMAYALEDAMDDGYYQMGYDAGKALNIFFFNDNNFKPVPTLE